MGKEEEGDGKEGRELLDFLAGDQKQIVLEPGIVGGQRQEQPEKADEEHYRSDLAPQTVTQQKLVRKQDPGGCKRNINNQWVWTVVAYRSFASPEIAGGHFDLLNFQTFLQDLGDDKGKLKQNYCLGFRKALTSDLQLEPLIRALTPTQVNKHPSSAIWK